jgi:hypothetical protein
MEVINFIKDNWAIITPVLVAIISEVMALNPKWKGNGILHLIVDLMSKKK